MLDTEEKESFSMRQIIDGLLKSEDGAKRVIRLRLRENRIL